MGKIKCKNLLGVATDLNIGNYDSVGIVPGMNMIEEEIALKFPHVFEIMKEDKTDNKKSVELKVQKEEKEEKEETIDVTNHTFEAEIVEKDSELKEEDVVTDLVVKEEIKEEVKATPKKITKKTAKKKSTKKKK